MKKVVRIIAVTLVTAFIFLMMCFPASAATEYGVYGQGGFDPPFSSKDMTEENILFIPIQIGSNEVYEGYYVRLSSDIKCRLIITDSEGDSSGKYCYYIQYNCGSSSSEIDYYLSYSIRSWRCESNSWIVKSHTPSYSSTLDAYGGCIRLFYSDNCYIDDEGSFHSYVVDSDGYDSSWYMSSAPFSWKLSTFSTYYIPTPLVSDLDDWAYNYGYETPEQEQEAIEQSRYDEQNKIIQEGFTRMEGVIVDAANQIEQAITNAAGEIINAGSDMPTLDTNNDWMNDSLTKVNEWLTQLAGFEEQMKANEEENSENMAQAKVFINGFFEKVPKQIIAGLALVAVIIVVIKAVGR